MIIRFGLASKSNVDDKAYSPASALLRMRTIVADWHKFSMVRHVRRRFLDYGLVVKRKFYLRICILGPHLGWFHRNLIDNRRYLLHQNNYSHWAILQCCLCGPTCSRFGTTPACNRRMDRQWQQISCKHSVARAKITFDGLMTSSREWLWTWLNIIGIVSSDWAIYHLLLAVGWLVRV